MGGQLLLLKRLMVITACFQSLCVSTKSSHLALVLKTEIFQFQDKRLLLDLIFGHLHKCTCVFLNAIY